MADGATIQRTSEAALAGENPVSLSDCLACAKKARGSGLTIPVVLMGIQATSRQIAITTSIQTWLALTEK